MNATGDPRVVLGLPVYNGENYLRDALNSLLNQTFEDWRIVIGDNASTDATPALGAAPNFNFAGPCGILRGRAGKPCPTVPAAFV